MIKVNHVTKNFKNNKGVYDVDFTINEGEVFGFLGPNGAGKSTTIRMLMGFMKSDSGTLSINGLDAFNERAAIQKDVGYIAGELALINEMNGITFLKTMGDLRGMTDFTRMNELIRKFQLDPKVPIHKMSKGMKQKVAIINALMHNPKVLILDEPTSGLDPLVQSIFLDEIQHEKEKGTTILMSSHSFTEVARTCDTICIIKDGRIVDIDSLQEIQKNARQIYTVTFLNTKDAVTFNQQHADSKLKDNIVTFYYKGDTNTILSEINHYAISHINVENESLEEIFMHFYERGENNETL